MSAWDAVLAMVLASGVGTLATIAGAWGRFTRGRCR